MTPTSNEAESDGLFSNYAARIRIQPRSVTGRYTSLRLAAVIITQAVFYGLPWLQWNDRQAVLFDLGARKFHLFGIVLWPQDFIYLAALLVICALSLFFVTAVAGRVWCGYACPQTVYTSIFMKIEEWIEGDRNKRLKLDASPWNFAKLRVRGFKPGSNRHTWRSLGYLVGMLLVRSLERAERVHPELPQRLVGEVVIEVVLLVTEQAHERRGGALFFAEPQRVGGRVA